MNDKPNCYECKWRSEIPGSCHSQCVNPKIGELGSIAKLAALFGGDPQLYVEGMTVEGDPHGIRRGWFMWPFNFDPVWLKSCDGFEAKVTPVEG